MKIDTDFWSTAALLVAGIVTVIAINLLATWVFVKFVKFCWGG